MFHLVERKQILDLVEEKIKLGVSFDSIFSLVKDFDGEVGDGDSDTENPDLPDDRRQNFQQFSTPKEALKHYYKHHLHDRDIECYDFRKELKILEWLYSRKGLSTTARLKT